VGKREGGEGDTWGVESSGVQGQREGTVGGR